jgi:hypothetical protein
MIHNTVDHVVADPAHFAHGEPEIAGIHAAVSIPAPAETVTTDLGARSIQRLRMIRTLAALLLPALSAVAADCSYVLSQDSTLAAAKGLVDFVRLTAIGDSCIWTTSADARWVEIYPQSGAGTADVRYTVHPNFSTGGRTAAIGIGDERLVITQQGSTGNYRERLVGQLYFRFFGRLPSEDELNQQTGSLDRGSTLESIVDNFFRSEEFNMNGRFVAGLYIGLLNRDADFSNWVANRNSVQTGTLSPDQLALEFLNSEEFRTRYGILDDDAFVRLLYRQVLLREPADEEVGFQSGVLQAGATRAQLATNLLNSEEFRIGTGPRLTAFLLYATVLFRDPTAAEFSNAIALLSQGTDRLEVIRTVLNSTEFAADLL